MKNTTGTPVKTVCWPLDSCSCCLCGWVSMMLTTASDVSQNCPIHNTAQNYFLFEITKPQLCQNLERIQYNLSAIQT